MHSRLNILFNFLNYLSYSVFYSILWCLSSGIRGGFATTHENLLPRLFIVSSFLKVSTSCRYCIERSLSINCFFFNIERPYRIKPEKPYLLGKQTGISQNNIGKICNGETSTIRFDIIAKICKTLDCSINDLFETDDPQLKRLLSYSWEQFFHWYISNCI